MSHYDVDEEVSLLLNHLTRIGQQHNPKANPIKCTFGNLFNDPEVEQTFESLAGTLKAARTRGFIAFEGSLLLMPTHKDVVITLKDPSQAKPTAVGSGSATGQSSEQLKKRRSDFEAERALFETKMATEWSAEAIHAYETAKLDAEIAFFNSAKKDAPPPPQVARAPPPGAKGVQVFPTTVVKPAFTKPVAAPAIAPNPMPAPQAPPTPVPQAPPTQDNSEVVKVIRQIMNKVFVTLKAKFEADTKYNTDYVLEATRDTIVATTTENDTDPNIATLKKVLNQVYQDFKLKFNPEQTYGGSAILEEVKSIIVNTTNSLTAAQVQPTPPPATQPASPKPSFPKPTAAKPPPLQVPSASTGPTEIPSPVRSPTGPRVARPAGQQDGESGNTKLSVAKIREEAMKRINNEPRVGQADLRDPAILSAYVRMRDNDDPLSWVIFGYDTAKKDKLFVADMGEGDFNEFYDAIPEDKPVYMFLNYKFGDTGRNKSVFMSYVPDSLNGLTKAKVVGHRADIEKFVKYMHISWHCLSYDEIKEADLQKMLLNAGGANYSVQEDNKGNFSSYKNTTKSFYEEKDKETEVKAVYNTGPLSTTPCDISGRAMVAPQAEFKSNTSNFFKGKV